MTWKPKNSADRHWLRGVRDAAALADTYNSVTTHPYQLGDCILGKFNLIARPRKNKRAARVAPEGREPPQGPWTVVRTMRGDSLFVVEIGDDKSATGRAYAFRIEAEALAVRDALNGVAALAAPPEGR